jgi:hypothetical protein
LKADPIFQFLQRFRHPWELKYFHLKWGGPLGRETFVHPYDGIPQLEVLRSLEQTRAFQKLQTIAPSTREDLLEPIPDPNSSSSRNVIKQLCALPFRLDALRKCAKLRPRLLARTELIAEYLRAIRASGATPRVLEVGNSKGHFGLLLSDLAPGAHLHILDSDPVVGRIVAILNSIDSISVTGASVVPNTELDLVWFDPDPTQEFPILLEHIMQQNARHIFVVRGLTDRREQMQRLLDRSSTYRLEHAPYRDTDTFGIAVLSLRTTTRS